MSNDDAHDTTEERTEHPAAEEHGTSHVVRKQGLGGAIGTSVGTVTGAAAGAALGGFAGPAGMAAGALIGAGLGAVGGKAIGDPVNSELEQPVREDRPREPAEPPRNPSGE